MKTKSQTPKPRVMWAAIVDGKRPLEATIYLQDVDGEEFKLTLKGESFLISGFKTPAVKMEQGADEDPLSEFHAVLLEKKFLIDKGLSHFNFLFSMFLSTRLVVWPEMTDSIAAWITE